MKNINISELKNSLISLSNQNQIILLRKLVDNYNDFDIAFALSKIETKIVLKILRMLTSNKVADIFSYLNLDQQEKIITAFSSIEISNFLANCFSDDVVDLIEELPAKIVRKILRASPEKVRKDINKILSYQENTAGSIMNVNFIKVYQKQTIENVIQTIKNKLNFLEETNIFYVVNYRKELCGSISLSKIFFNKNALVIDDLYQKNIPFVFVDEDQEKVAKKMTEYDLNQIPVVDKSLKLLGIITIDDIVDVIEAETTEDIEKQAGILPSEKTYFQLSVLKLVKLRVFWLLFLMISATLSQVAISFFMHIYHVDSGAHAHVINFNSTTMVVTYLLVPLIPLVSGTCGNAGSQSSIMVVRGLSLGYIKTRDWYRIIWKETQVGFLIGMILISINFIRMLAIFAIQEHSFNLAHQQWYAIATLSLALLTTIIISKVVGGILPIISKKFKIDPAVIAAPLLTTLVDALSTTIFFALSLIFFASLIPH